MGGRKFLVGAGPLIGTGSVLILSIVADIYLDLDRSNSASFILKLAALCICFALVIVLHRNSFSDPDISVYPNLYLYLYPVIISLTLVSWWPVIRVTGVPKVVEQTRFLAWY